MSDQTQVDPRVGSTLSGYQLESILGAGAMGVVYRAIGPDGTMVALKLIKPSHSTDTTFVRRFQREARVAQTIEHPNVVPVLEVGECDGLWFMVQRFVAGRSLAAQLRADSPLEPMVAVRICADVASGLEAVWAAGFVHRDIKPANILLDESGTALITDFGLTKDTQGSLLTLPGQTLGSIDYISPEQIRGEEVTAASDIYSLGCVMFECAVGQPMFGHVQGMRALWAHLDHEPPDPTELRPELSPAFAQALLTAVAKDPAERPATAGDYARRLAEAYGTATSAGRSQAAP
jgi:serine/threonine-protein kinase